MNEPSENVAYTTGIRVAGALGLVQHQDPLIVTTGSINDLEMMKRDGVPVELIVKVLRRSAALKGETPDALGQILSFITHFLGANSYDLSSRIPREFVDQTYAVAHGVSGAGMVALPNGINANSN